MQGQRFGGYELVERRRTVGIAESFAARQTSIGMAVTLWRVLPGLADDADFREIFVEKAKLSMVLEHPCIVRVVDAGEVDGIPYLATEPLDGATLAELGKVPASGGVCVAHDLARALEAAHFCPEAPGQTVLHRDVSPANVLVLPDGSVKVGGFAVAEALSQQGVTRSGTLSAQLRYMAPEYALTGQYTKACDLFSAGVVLYEALAGRHPHEGLTAFELADAMASGDHPPLGEACPDAPSGLVAIVERLLRPEPAERFSDAAQVRDALEAMGIDGGGRRALASLVAGAVAPTAEPPPIAGPPALAAPPPIAAPPTAAAAPAIAAPPVVSAAQLVEEDLASSEPATVLDKQPLGAMHDANAHAPPAAAQEEDEPATTLDMRALSRQLHAEQAAQRGPDPAAQAYPVAGEPPPAYPPTAVLPDSLQAQIQSEYGQPSPALPPMPPPSWEANRAAPRPVSQPAAPSEPRHMPSWLLTALGVLGVAALIGVAVLLAILAAKAS